MGLGGFLIRSGNKRIRTMQLKILAQIKTKRNSREKEEGKKTQREIEE